MRYRLLGPLEVEDNSGTAVLVATGKERVLLTRLLLDADRVVSTARLVEDLWGDAAPETVDISIRVHISRLRRRLADAGAPNAIRTQPPGYVLDLDTTDTLDIRQASHLMAEARQVGRADREAAADLLGQALTLWRGQPLAGLDDVAFARTAIVNLEGTRLDGLRERAEHLIAVGRPAEAIAELEPEAIANPTREDLWSAWMKALYAAGRQADALRAYETLRDYLVDALGVSPAPDVERLHLAILNQAPELEVQRVTPPEPTTPASGLPAPLTPLVGRQHELSETARWMAESRVVTIVGPGGVGKTRLALDAASAAAPRHGDSVWFVDLTPVRDVDAVATTLAAAVGVSDAAAATVEEALRAHFTGRDALIVVDNCEHVLVGAARLIDHLVGSVRDIRVLATSREPLGLLGEAVVQLGPLPVPDLGGDVAGDNPSVQLFVDRARRVRSSFTVEPEIDAVAEVCRRLDGIPLAIELAAARCQAMTARQIADRLDSRFSLLAGPETLLPRHQTLRTVVEWSYELLSDPQQRIFRRLSIFAGRFTLDAAEAICGDDVDDPAATLAALVAKSVVVFEADDGGPAYRLLETMQHFAAALLTDEECERLRRRFVDWYVAFAERFGSGFEGQGRAAGPSEFVPALEDLRRALEWSREYGGPGTLARLAVSLGAFWSGRGLLREGRSWLGAAVDDAPDDAQRARLHYWMAVIGGLGMGDYEAGEDAAARSLELWRAAGDDVGAAHASLILAAMKWVRHGREAAIPYVHEGLSLYEAVGHAGHVGFATDYLGFMHQVGGDFDEARRLYTEALASQQAHGDEAEVAWEFGRLGALDLASGDVDGARPNLERAVATLRAVGSRRALGVALGYLSSLELRSGNPALAADLAAETLAAGRETGSITLVSSGLMGLAEAAAARGDYGEARSRLADYLGHAVRRSYREGIAAALEVNAALDADVDPDSAVAQYAAADRIRDELSIAKPPHHRGAVAALRERLGSDFAAAWERGRAADDPASVFTAAATARRSG